ncbi:DUF4097 family beta strand repeat-containing protein [Streptomyces sp. NPDC091377]|uniref:DUF4097 family beta strand repeat-containing protein n=1 Tax=Streptomyces sp. NPDC091377 TaxID=3365995 RepID=UPI00380EEDC1
MPAFDTPGPISVTIDIGGVGDLLITAEDRTDTVVQVRPTDENDASDVKVAEQASVQFTDGVLVIRTPKPRPLGFSKKSQSVDVSIVLPTGSRLRGESAVGDLRGSGRLGECAYKTATGHVQLDHVEALRVRTSAGHVTVGRVDGDAEISTSTGRIRAGEIGGSVTVKNSNGNTDLGRVAGDIQVRCSNGDITVRHAHGARTEAETANGSIRLGEVTSATVVLKTATGDLELGIGAGLPAKLSLSTGFGRVHNMLESTAESAEKSVAVRGETSFGDITVHRAS